MKTLLFSLSFILFGVCVAQKSFQEKRGDKMYNIYAYSHATEHYSKSDTLSTEGLRRLADSYYRMNDFVLSFTEYSKLVERDNCTANDYFGFANVLKSLSLYAEADEWMLKYNEIAPMDIRAKNNTDILNKTMTLRLDRGFFSVNNLGINTAKQEFGPSLYANQLIYSASREKKGLVIKKSIETNQQFLDLYVVDTAEMNDVSRTEFVTKFNKKYHEGTVSITGDYQRMYFTSNNYKNKSKDGARRLQLYYADFQLTGEWGEQQSFQYNSPDYSIGHPDVSDDGKTLYFSSDMPGGYGGVDIYMSKLDTTNSWSLPVNLGPGINTEGDELYPFFNEENSILFFSSNGHFGLGGLDIYACSVREGIYGKINNFGIPLNSSADDFGLVVYDDLKNGFFSSNRIEGKGDDDIWKVAALKKLELDEYKKEIKGVAYDENNEPLMASDIFIFNEKGVKTDSTVSNIDGAYSFMVKPFEKYMLVGSKYKYKSDTSYVSAITKENLVSSKLQLVMEIEKIPIIIVEVDHELFLSVKTIYFDLRSAKLRVDTKNLDEVVQVLNDYPTMEIELGSHTDCRGTERFNQDLSDRRAINSVEYIKQRITNPDRIHGKGYGESRLLNGCACEGNQISNCSEEEHQQNRRTEFKIIKQ
jgi:outer membrane protein OmpA-like peptidoglycan-associated protein